MTIDDAVKQIEAAEALLAAGGGAVVDIAAVSLLKDAYIVELKETQERLDKLEADVKQIPKAIGDAVDAWVPCKYKDVKSGETLRKDGQEYKKTAKVIGGQTVSEWGDKAWFFKDESAVEVLRRVVPVSKLEPVLQAGESKPVWRVPALWVDECSGTGKPVESYELNNAEPAKVTFRDLKVGDKFRFASLQFVQDNLIKTGDYHYKTADGDSASDYGWFVPEGYTSTEVVPVV